MGRIGESDDTKQGASVHAAVQHTYEIERFGRQSMQVVEIT